MESVVEVFGSWRDLKRSDKRELLRAYRMELVVEKEGTARRSRLRVDRLKLGDCPPYVWLYKKMKRLGIE